MLELLVTYVAFTRLPAPVAGTGTVAVAVPFWPLRGAVADAVPALHDDVPLPYLNCTVPVGVSAEPSGAFTVATKLLPVFTTVVRVCTLKVLAYVLAEESGPEQSVIVLDAVKRHVESAVLVLKDHE